MQIFLSCPAWVHIRLETCSGNAEEIYISFCLSVCLSSTLLITHSTTYLITRFWLLWLRVGYRGILYRKHFYFLCDTLETLGRFLYLEEMYIHVDHGLNSSDGISQESLNVPHSLSTSSYAVSFPPFGWRLLAFLQAANQRGPKTSLCYFSFSMTHIHLMEMLTSELCESTQIPLELLYCHTSFGFLSSIRYLFRENTSELHLVPQKFPSVGMRWNK